MRRPSGWPGPWFHRGPDRRRRCGGLAGCHRAGTGPGAGLRARARFGAGAGGGNHGGLHHIAAHGALLVLGALGGGSGRSVDDPVAGGMVRHFGLIAAGALLPVAGRAELPVGAVAVGMLALGGREGIAEAAVSTATPARPSRHSSAARAPPMIIRMDVTFKNFCPSVIIFSFPFSACLSVYSGVPARRSCSSSSSLPPAYTAEPTSPSGVFHVTSNRLSV